MPYIYLTPIEPADISLLEDLSQFVRRAFGVSTRIDERRIDLDCAYDSQRGQYNSSKILIQLVRDNPPSDALKVLGITHVDLFLPIFTFQFGQAQLDNIGALLSTYRLHNRFYGLPDDRALYLERVEKEAIHELGHTFGLVHCYDPFCVMRSSTYVEDVDQKSIEFCGSCASRLAEKLRSLGR
ncbi:MAG: archaemetzincin family Zn-dependent metalloprotease [Candidatus Alcyoniella australis]|nr:archaemetzincin family Zn-dependent metalloprotease [Candidatus Alcyoniella australis]